MRPLKLAGAMFGSYFKLHDVFRIQFPKERMLGTKMASDELEVMALALIKLHEKDFMSNKLRREGNDLGFLPENLQNDIKKRILKVIQDLENIVVELRKV